MEAYRMQQFAYLVVPVMLGLEFFIAAKDEKKVEEETPFGSYVLDFFGFVFVALFPAFFIFTIWAVEGKKFIFGAETLARFDRYGVMFFFLGAWWQVCIISALRARRLVRRGRSDWYVWAPYLLLGAFISALILWVAPWGLMWVSVAWFVLSFGALKFLRVSYRNIERVFWVLALCFFLFENALFIFLESVM